jgi:hypothetical protein
LIASDSHRHATTSSCKTHSCGRAPLNPTPETAGMHRQSVVSTFSHSNTTRDSLYILPIYTYFADICVWHMAMQSEWMRT